MKKILSIILCVLMLASMVALTGCGNTETPNNDPATNNGDANNNGDTNNDGDATNNAAGLKFGAAVYVEKLKASDASADKDGEGVLDVTMAAVTVDADGKIVACRIDTMQNTVKYTTDGKAIGNPEAKSKRELGNAYGMSSIGKKEWFEQVDALEGVVAGKTLDEVKALIATDGKAADAVITAGCTIGISSYINAVEKAYNAAAESTVTADATLKIGMYTVQDTKDATADKDGSNKVSVYGFAAAVDANGKVIKSFSDCVEADFTFTTAGKATFDATKELKSKFEQGSNYGMVAYGGAKQEWYIQAMAFDAQCVGKTGAEIAALQAADGKGVESLQTAGCTIYVNGFVKAASKI